MTDSSLINLSENEFFQFSYEQYSTLSDSITGGYGDLPASSKKFIVGTAVQTPHPFIIPIVELMFKYNCVNEAKVKQDVIKLDATAVEMCFLSYFIGIENQDLIMKSDEIVRFFVCLSFFYRQRFKEIMTEWVRLIPPKKVDTHKIEKLLFEGEQAGAKAAIVVYYSGLGATQGIEKHYLANGKTKLRVLFEELHEKMFR